MAVSVNMGGLRKMAEISLYDDQLEVLNELKAAMGRSKSVLLQSATGSGKTRMATWLINEANKKGNSVIFTVPRRQLRDQSSEAFTELGINHSFVAAGKPFNPFAKVHIGMVDTMARRLDKLPQARIVILDECHFGANSLGDVINEYKRRGSWVIGLSATPWKSSGKGLGCWFDDMVIGKPMRWLIDNKRLSDYRYFMGKTHVDFSKARVMAGEYNSKDVDGIIEANEGVIIGDAVRDYREKAMGRLHVVRCVSIKRSQIMAQSFRDAGVPAMHVDGDTDDDELKKILKAYARREILVLTFCDLLNFGFDLAQNVGMDVCVESGDDTKPSLSLAGQMQYWGRMLRYKDYPALIFDRVNNWQRHGLPCDEREWTLEDRVQSKKASDRATPTKQCDSCFHIHKPAPVCPECGNVYEIKSREIDEVEGELQEVSKADIEAARIRERQEQGKADSLEGLIAIAKKKGYKNPTFWASKVMAGRMMKGKRK